MRKQKKQVSLVILAVAIIIALLYGYNQKITLCIGIFAGSNWDVPTSDYYQMIDQAISQFTKKHKNVEVTYKSGILKEDYSSWLASLLLNGTEPDLYMVLNEDFNSLAALGALEPLDAIINQDDSFKSNKFYQSALDTGIYQNHQYALPYEVNPTLMFVNKTLLQKEGIALPDDNWTLNDFYSLCKQITKDSNGDGLIDQYGCYNYDWISSLYAKGIELFNETGTRCSFNTSEFKDAIMFIEKLNALNQGYTISSIDFDQGKVAFSPMQFSQYRTYQPYPYRVSKYSTFEWDVVEMPQASNNYLTQLSSLMMGLSSRSEHLDLSWELLKTFTYNQQVQANIYQYSQGVSPLKAVTESKQVLALLQEESLGTSTIDMQVLSKIMANPTTNTRFKKYDAAMKLADNQINVMINDNSDLDSALIALQKEITNYLNE